MACGCFNFMNDDCFLWIILIVAVLGILCDRDDDCGCGCGNNNNGCGCGC